nr:integrase, catalytic region, zinc finger, CCHC-type, peptidase aspartic, catalytic [Tanacetum cinerariifolium]
MTTPTVTSSTDSQMHNNIMAAGSKDHPPILATGRYPQWRSRFLRYIDTRPNGEALRKCILSARRFVTIVKQQHKLDEASYHKLFEILKQYQKEVNELYAERLASNANPLALVATAQANPDPYYQTSESCKSYAPSSKPSIPTRSHTTTRYKGKEVSKLITPPSETASEEDSDPEQAQRDKDMQKNLALIAKYFKKIYKPTNNNLRTSLNSRNKNVDTTLRYKNDNQSGQFGNQRMMNVAGARENKAEKVKDFAYHKKKMLLFKQAEQGVPLQPKQYDWIADTDEEINEQELEAHYSYMAKIQEQSESIINTCLVKTNDSNVIPDSPDICNDDIQNDQNDVESDDERVALANLKLDVDEKKIQKKLKKANTTLAQELKECKTILAKTSRTMGESISVRDSCLVALQNKQTEFEKYKAFNDRTIEYDKIERKLNETLGQLALKDIEIKEGLKTKAYEISVVKEKHDELIKQILLTKSHYKGLVKKKTKIEQQSPSGYKWVPKTKMQWVPKAKNENVQKRIVQLILFIVDSGCTKHMTGNIMINKVYYIEGLNHNLFSVGQFCDADLEVAFRKSTCFVRDLQGNDLLAVESIHIRFDEIKEVSETSVANYTSGLVPQRQKTSDYENSDPIPQLQNVSSLADAHVPSQQELDLLFGPLHDEFFNADQKMCMFALTVSTAEPKNIKEAMADSAWIEAMQEELYQFDRIQVWELVDKPFGKTVIRLKWYFSLGPVKEEVYVAQPDGFVDPDPDHPE